MAVSSGVPQGSVLEPILFPAYINDLMEQVRSRVRLFADDTAMYLALDNQADLEFLQKDLKILENWEKLWDMSFNPSKCHVIHVTRLKTPLQTKYHLHGCVLEESHLQNTYGHYIRRPQMVQTHQHYQKGKSNTRFSQTQYSGPQQGPEINSIQKRLSAHS